MSSFTQEQLVRGKATDLWRYLSAYLEFRPGLELPAEVFRRRWPTSLNAATIDAGQQKTAVGAITAAGPLTQLAHHFFAFVHVFTLIARIAGLRRGPFNTPLSFSTQTTARAFVGSAKPIPLAAGALENEFLTRTKIATILPISLEQFRLQAPGSDVFVRDGAAASITAALDVAFTDPTLAAVPDVSPASITYGVSPIAATGVPETDFKELIGEFLAGGGHL